MSSFHQVTIGGYPSGGLTTDRKPLMLADNAFSVLENAYVWRERTKKRDGDTGMGRLQRFFSGASLGNSDPSSWSFNIYSTLASPITPETNAEIAEGSVQISLVGLSTPFVDQGNGILTNSTAGNSGKINYLTGAVVLTFNVSSGTAATITFGYFPSLPVMGICKQDIAKLGIDNTIFFDKKYAYQFTGGIFQELISSTPTTWTGPDNANGTNTYFFWSCNYQGADSSVRLFFATNNNITLGAATPYDPIRYYNNSTWTDLQPLVTATITLWQGLIIVPYYGRLLILNTWEGATSGGPEGATNFFARCRFSALGVPIVAGTGSNPDAWRVDVFGNGGFLDAPTNETIVSAAFFRNVLIVFFEYSTWQLRYIGEYGLPFIFERISSDFGATSTFSPIIFDQGVMAVSGRGIIQASAGGVSRIDDQIPETAFGFQIQNNAPDFVHGIRDYEKEVSYWNYIDDTTDTTYQNWPTTTLLFNYRNNTWAQFRNTLTCFGPAQFPLAITWDSLTTSWDDLDVTWDNVDDQIYTEYVTAGNQQGFISIYENQNAEGIVASPLIYAPSLAITAISGDSPNIITIPQHNLANGEFIYIAGALWLDGDPGFNNKIYKVSTESVNTITLGSWTGINYAAVSLDTSGNTYIGGGLVTLLPVMNIVGKDFNPFQAQGKQFKLSFIDFQMDANQSQPSIPAITIQCFVNSYLGLQANLLTGNQELLNNSQQAGFITSASQTNPCQITSPGYSLPTDSVVYIANVQGMTELNAANYTITVVDANNFTLNGVDATGFTAYTQGGSWNSLPERGQTYTMGAEYAWYRFYSTQFGQYLRVAITYDDLLMNQLATHQSSMELNAMNFWFKEGGRLVN